MNSSNTSSSSASSIKNTSRAFKHIVIGGQSVTVNPDCDDLNKGQDAIKSFIEHTAVERTAGNDQQAFYVVDLGNVIEKYQTWANLLPGVVPYYAVKCNEDPVIMSVLARLGSGFDCASKNEIRKVLEDLDVPVRPSRIIYANTIKEPSFIQYAAERGVNLMTFDCEEELHKIKNNHSTPQLLVRINAPLSPQSVDKIIDGSSEIPLSTKFGCSPTEAVRLLAIAESLELRVVGVSFYAGHRCYDASVYRWSVAAAKSVFDAAVANGHRRLEILDIGGGFYGDRTGSRLAFVDAAASLRSAIKEYFGDELSTGTVQVIGEPGSYMVASACNLVVNVIGVRRQIHSNNENCSLTEVTRSSEHKPHFDYFLNDGLYGSFQNYDNYNKARIPCYVPYRIASQKNSYKMPGVEGTRCCNGHGNLLPSMTIEELFDSTLWGPTCDPRDYISSYCAMERLELGDWLVFEDMGFYTTAVSSNFNGMPKPSMVFTIEEKYIEQLLNNHK